jgi:prepilin-type N-terminal cleavage/methylation domain-containing protein
MFNNKFNNKIHSSSDGFTLIELLVVIMMLSVLIVGLILIVNPIAQINKVKDAQRMQDLTQVKNALDAFYNDNGCYPQSLTFGSPGSPWAVGQTVYMQKVPQDPDCGKAGGYCYAYQVDTTSSCPQWSILFARLSKKPDNSADSCFSVLRNSLCSVQRPLVNPIYSTQGYCVFLGAPDCTYLKSNMVSTPGTLTPTPTPTNTLPAPSGVDCRLTGYYAVSGGLCNYLGTDQGNECTIHRHDGAGLPCYSGPGNNICSGDLCTQ